MSNEKIVGDPSNVCVAIASLANHFALDKRMRMIEPDSFYHDKVIIQGSNIFVLQIGTKWFFLDENVTISTTIDLDTGAIAAGNDYYVYACDDGESMKFKMSLQSTYPNCNDSSGNPYTANNTRKIGGFHTLCVSVGTIGGHSLSDYVASDILPLSIWDLKHRAANGKNEGTVYSEEINRWVAIYLASGTGSNTASVYGAAISSMRNWMDSVDDGHAVGKRLPSDGEFQAIMAGSNEETRIAGGADPVTTGGHSDSAGRRIISNIGCEDCCGCLQQWLRVQTYKPPAVPGWGWYDVPGGKGSLYNYGGLAGDADVKVMAGGTWGHGSYCGSRSRYLAHTRSQLNTNISARLLAKAL